VNGAPNLFVATGRCGSTMIQNIINAHPDISNIDLEND